MKHVTPQQLAAFFDHTLLRADATDEALHQLCRDAKRYGFAAVAVNSAAVPLCKEALAGSGVAVGAATGFPLGQMSLESKLYETQNALDAGAAEIDYVVNLARVKAGDDPYIKDEMERIVAACKEKNAVSKVIFENCYLTDDEKKRLCGIALQVKPDFIKTSTGFGSGGATLADVKLMKAEVGDEIAVKAAGGIRTLDVALAMIDAGAGRIGSSASKEIVNTYRALLESLAQ